VNKTVHREHWVFRGSGGGLAVPVVSSKLSSMRLLPFAERKGGTETTGRGKRTGEGKPRLTQRTSHSLPCLKKTARMLALLNVSDMDRSSIGWTGYPFPLPRKGRRKKLRKKAKKKKNACGILTSNTSCGGTSAKWICNKGLVDLWWGGF